MRRRLPGIALVLICLASPLQAASKLKGFYSGSGGFTQEVHRVVMVEFAEDGSAILQQKWTGKDEQVWHAHWTKEGKQVRIVFDSNGKEPAIDPLICEMKHDTLVPVSWDAKAMGVLGPPKLAPFGGKNVQQHSVLTCQNLDIANPGSHCITWDSRDKR